MEHVASSCLIFFALVTFFIAMPFATGFSLTKGNSYLANYVIKTLFVQDWISCTLACQVEEMCVSYNYNTITRACDLNVEGIHEPLTGADELVKMHGVVFHQIKPAERMLPPRKVQSLNQCDCSCASESACRPGQDSDDSLPISCKEIWKKTNIRVDGTFYIRTGLPSRYEEVFCHMTPINGCGDGGWTLVMKIDGKKKTFTFDSRYWTDNVTYNVAGGTSLEKVETKLSTYWSTPFTRLCLGMSYENEEAKWISLSYSGSSLWHVISNGTYIPTNLTAGEWKKLLDNSTIRENCTQQGFNSGNEDARARIGIVGDDSPCVPKNSFKSRIGFGASGSWYGMNNDNSCGNECERKVSKEAFGYIFVQ
ncbi:unnamed protein product [Porites lobata]|uniref:Apple domain-containing protein n=1 Tax=Porites lobata TaxID=104759 RepID=A0ABN8REK3_9CNID|nr:unnamed protein product [Porites lobata]